MSSPEELLNAAKDRIRETRERKESARLERIAALKRKIDRAIRREAARLQGGSHAAELLEEAATLASETPVTQLQIAVMLVKYRSGVRPGDKEWNEEDQRAFDSMGSDFKEPPRSALTEVNVDDIEQTLRVQFSKLINFFSSDLDPRWGGTFYQDSPIDLQGAFEAFCAERVGEGVWAHKRNAGTVWGPGNVVFTTTPWSGFRDPLEPYFSCDGVTLPLEEAANVLGVSGAELLELKLEVFRDEDAVIRLFMERPDE